MKRLFYISLLFIYLFTATGVMVTFHYCCGKFDAIELNSNVKDLKKSCSKKGGSKKCCESKSEFIKVKDNSLKSNLDFNLKTFVVDCAVSDLFVYHASNKTSYQKTEWNKAPPNQERDLYILFHSLII